MVHRAEAASPVSTDHTWDVSPSAGPAWHVWRWFRNVVWLPEQEWVTNTNFTEVDMWWSVTLRVNSCKMVSVVSLDENEKYVVLIFENEITLSEQIILEEIFTEMGKRHNISCFPAKLSFEEASNRRLKAHQCAQKQEVGQGMHLLCLSPLWCSKHVMKMSLVVSNALALANHRSNKHNWLFIMGIKGALVI